MSSPVVAGLVLIAELPSCCPGAVGLDVPSKHAKSHGSEARLRDLESPVGIGAVQGRGLRNTLCTMGLKSESGDLYGAPRHRHDTELLSNLDGRGCIHS